MPDWDSLALIVLAAIGFITFVLLAVGSLAPAFFSFLKGLKGSYYEYVEWDRNERRNRGLDTSSGGLTAQELPPEPTAPTSQQPAA